ncbi:uncharacterized protein LOC142760524 [Rhinoderma darwinii]|uniref:uncharacterized protein LOC142760524 n=1 Tax=Rhinoderma darwinii TaxID=43563 RepID=UPI003F672BA9
MAAFALSDLSTEVCMSEAKSIFSECELVHTTQGASLKSTFKNLTRLHKDYTRSWWEIQSLENYLKNKIVPRGLRVPIVPASRLKTSNIKERWEQEITGSSLRFMQILVEEEIIQFDHISVELKKEIEIVKTLVDTPGFDKKDKILQQSLERFTNNLKELEEFNSFVAALNINALGLRFTSEISNQELSFLDLKITKTAEGAGFFFVGKKDGGLRPCIDYRNLNKVTVRNQYPLPLIPDLFNQVQGAQWFSKFDLRGAYNLIRIKEGDEWKTAFNTPEGHFEYLVMPFGLCNAPAVFQNFINEILREYLGNFLVVYLDDILVFSKDWSSHVEHVRKVLQVLRENNLFAKTEKCVFGVQERPFLGQILTPHEFRMDPAKVQAVAEWVQPASLKALQCFLGFANYYRRFIANFSVVAKPLTDLTRKGAGFFFVGKKDGGLRPCIDYRNLNKVTVRNQYPLPLIPDLFNQVQGAQWFSKFDLRGAYNLIRIKEGDEWKTAFNTPEGHFEYLVMPFGLCNAPAVSQNFINEILRDYLGNFLVVYLDDILVFSKDWSSHVEHFRKVLQVLRENNLFAKTEKCVFGVQEIPFLGQILTPHEFRMDPAKVQAVAEWVQPASLKALQCFLGFANYYRRFIANFSVVAKPLTDLTRKGADVLHWPPEAVQAFETLKKRLKENMEETDAAAQAAAQGKAETKGRTARWRQRSPGNLKSYGGREGEKS